MAKLGNVCDFYSGTGFPNEHQGNCSGQYPFYKVGDISRNVIAGNKFLKFCQNYVDDDIVKIIRGTIIPQGTIVFAKIGEALRLNRRAITSCNCLVDNNVMGLRPNTQIWDLTYFFYWMTNLDLQQYAESTTVPSIRKTKLAEIEIVIPSLEDQKEISTILDKLDNLLFLRKQQLSKLDELVKARFVEMFGDIPAEKYVTIKEVCKIITDGTHQPPKFVESGIPFLFVSNVVENRITYDTEKFISEETYLELIKRTPIEIGDILLSTVGSYGHPAMVMSKERFCFQRHIAYLKPNKTLINSSYFYGTLLSDNIQQQIEERVKGVAQKTLNLSEIRTIRIPLPTMELQQQFSTFTAQIDKFRLTIQQSLDKLEMLKKALMQEYFG